MIFYFSGTGNSKHVAEKLHAELNGNLIAIQDGVQHDEYEYFAKNSEKIIFVFPVYYYGMPSIVAEFLQKLVIKSEDKTKLQIYGVITCGGTVQGADKKFRKTLKERGYAVRAVHDIRMVDNYVLMFKVVSESVQKNILAKAEIRLKEITNDIMTENKTGYTSSFVGTVVTNFVYPIYNLTRGTSKFHVNDNCIGCGLCQIICPSKTIGFNGRPFWKKGKCVHCLACINRCPVHAIEYGKSTKDKGRYQYPGLKK